MPNNSPPPSPRRPTTGLIERLYALWLVSSLLLLLLVVVITLLGSGQLRRHAETISEQSRAIDELRAELSRTRRELDGLKRMIAEAETAGTEPPTPAENRPPTPPVADEPTRPPGQEPESEPHAAVPAPAGEGDVDALLNAALRPSGDGSYELADRAVAEAALREGLQTTPGASWSGTTWGRLAVVARLLDRDEAAGALAQRAIDANEPPLAYYEVSARRLLAKGQIAEAIVFANRLAAGRPADPNAGLLLAEAQAASGDLAAAAVAIDKIQDTEHLSLAGKLRLGDLFVALEQWGRLDKLLASLKDVPQPALPELNFLRAVSAIRDERLAEGLAILDNLLANSASAAKGFPVPDEYELRTWRGVALLAARQFNAAREALAAITQEHPERPEAWYWRGMVELRAGQEDEAIAFFQHALAASRRFAPAWEAIGTIALNRGDLPTAIQNFHNAIGVNPQRASAYFLLAVAHAKLSQSGETAEALRSAFRVDPTLVDSAQQTPVISRMFTRDQLAALAGAAAPAAEAGGGDAGGG